MYRAVIVLSENRKKERLSRERTIENADRAELQKEIQTAIEDLALSGEFSSPTAEYIIERDGIYIDGEIDLKVKITKKGATVKLGELLI